jgi:5-methylcytosine-specific restriction endonuclease McrA
VVTRIKIGERNQERRRAVLEELERRGRHLAPESKVKRAIADAIREASPLCEDGPTKRARVNATLLGRDGPLCWLCGDRMDFRLDESGTMPGVSCDHVVPRSHGGPDSVDNLRLAHPSCNRARGSDPAQAHPKWIAYRDERRRHARRRGGGK